MFQFRKPTPGSAPLLAALFTLCLASIAPTPAAALTVGQRLKALESKVVTLQSTVVTLQSRVSDLDLKVAQQTAVNNMQVNEISSLKGTVQKHQSDNVAQSSQIAALADNLRQMQATVLELQHQGSEITALTNKLAHVSRVGNDLFITGANLHIVNGLGATNGDPNRTGTSHTNGVGNLIVGYNEHRGQGDTRSGSHNLVVGSYQNFSSYGGFVAGVSNDITGPFTSVVGGEFNKASGRHASVSGGKSNAATGESASVSGGQSNIASGRYASVSGGSGNAASDLFACVSGGTSNTASGLGASVCGGGGNSAAGTYASVSGGGGNTASGQGSSVSGGNGNTASGVAASVSGGSANMSSGDIASVSGGTGNTADGRFASVGGGRGRVARGLYNWAAGSLFQDF